MTGSILLEVGELGALRRLNISKHGKVCGHLPSEIDNLTSLISLTSAEIYWKVLFLPRSEILSLWKSLTFPTTSCCRRQSLPPSPTLPNYSNSICPKTTSPPTSRLESLMRNGTSWGLRRRSTRGRFGMGGRGGTDLSSPAQAHPAESRVSLIIASLNCKRF